MKVKIPTHCKGCTKLYSAGRKNPTGGLEKYNSWCCAKDAPAAHSVGWCKTHDAKIERATIAGWSV